jgi:hypothetical protein
LGGAGEATDFAVAQAVVDEGEDSAGGGDPADVAAATLGDPPVVGLNLAAAVILGHRLDGRPPHMPGTLFADPEPVDLGVGLPMLGGQTGPG